MLGLAVLFFLGVWIVITIVAMIIGWKFAQKRWGIKAELLGAFLGFMLTMGGFIIYWTIEYYQIQRTVTKLCETEGGIKVYVTPKEWRKQIGEEEWTTLYPFTNLEIRNNKPTLERINHLGDVYKYTPGIFRAGNIENSRITLYSNSEKNKYRILKFSDTLADRTNGNVLIKKTYFIYPVSAVANNLSGLKFWLSSIKDCDIYDSKFHNLALQYSNLTQGEKNDK